MYFRHSQRQTEAELLRDHAAYRMNFGLVKVILSHTEQITAPTSHSIKTTAWNWGLLCRQLHLHQQHTKLATSFSAGGAQTEKKCEQARWTHSFFLRDEVWCFQFVLHLKWLLSQKKKQIKKTNKNITMNENFKIYFLPLLHCESLSQSQKQWRESVGNHLMWAMTSVNLNL